MNRKREEVLGAIEETLDRYIEADLTNKNVKLSKFRLKFLADKIGASITVLYNFNVYQYLTANYDSIEYLEYKGKIKVDLKRYCQERDLNIDQEQSKND